MNDPIITRARNYLAKLPPAIAGSGGDAATYKAALALVRGFSIPPPQALPLLVEWNAACLPSWTEGELRAKLASAARSATPAGYLLQDDRAPVDPGADRVAKRRTWPSLRRPTADDLIAIAALRHVSTEAAGIVASHRHLWRCRWRDAECFAIRSGTFAQVRRLDGQPFTRPDGSTLKALNLPGSEGAFLNPGGMGNPDVPVILTEGAISILESADATRRADAITRTLHPLAILAAVSAGSRFTTGHLQRLAGRRVRIIPDADTAGKDAAAHWTATLRTAGCTVDCVRMPAGCKDLGDALRHLPAGDSFWQQLLTF